MLKYQDKYRNFPDEERTRETDALMVKLQTYQGLLNKLNTPRVATVRTTFVIFHKIARTKKVSRAHLRTTHYNKNIAGNLELQLKNKVADFDCFSPALNKSCDVRDTAQLLIFLREISTAFQITEKLAAMKSTKKTTRELSDEDRVVDPGFAVDVTALMYSDCFHEKVAASPKPKEGQHSNPLFNTKRSHKTIRSPPHSEMHMGSSPFNCIVDNAPSDIQIELIRLQSDLLQADHLRSVLLLAFTPHSKRRTF
ncbi:unnamed protein product [Lepeophtheirus salmonis]|uniref:(salmon louse) hypothetical protein n=1 Tax=Lepeophtheirus salmonis TaxID=72036 RepID=A0A7R8CGK2_LEPSM|nr:unnamed protein product [Lepeophtheirus salmonis]CAF2816743.1 unnamed protein product [Lepeophtheirus salmonis]